MTKTLLLGGAMAFAIAYPTRAKAEPESDAESPGIYSYSWNEPRMVSGIGVGFVLGGGVTGFTDASARDLISSGVGGLWDVRASFGTHIPLGLDVSYIGTAAKLQTLGGQDNGTLVGTTVEAAIRYNILPHYSVNPYLFAGAGWQRYDITDMTFSTADTGVKKTDDLLEFPMGAGLSWRDPGGFFVDARGTFRAATDSDLIVDRTNGGNASLHTWEASGNLGYEF